MDSSASLQMMSRNEFISGGKDTIGRPREPTVITSASVRVDTSSRKEGKRRDACERDGGKTGRRKKEHDGGGGSESFFYCSERVQESCDLSGRCRATHSLCAYRPHHMFLVARNVSRSLSDFFVAAMFLVWLLR